MRSDWDIVIRGATVIDGTGAPARVADVAIRGEIIAEVGKISGRGREEIDARGRLVTPGFVDLHTHYDGQVTWEQRLVPSSMHGVTTAILGNCGVGFAPCRPSERDELVRLMEGVEDIPGVVMTEGIPWNWESYPQYLDTLAARRFDMDVGSYLPHAPLRVYVMGRRATDLEPATAQDCQRMADLAEQAITAGALGIATSRTLIHRSRDGSCIPTLRAEEQELKALAGSLKGRSAGVLQVVTDFDEPERVFSQLKRLAAYANRPLMFTLTEKHDDPDLWRLILRWVHDAHAQGIPIYPQVLPRAVGVLYSHALSLNPFYSTPTYQRLAHLPLPIKLKELRRADVRESILSETSDPDPANRLGLKVRWFHRMFELGDPPEYEPSLETSIAARADRMGISPEALAYDLLMKNEGSNILYMTSVNYADGTFSAVRDMLRDTVTVPGLGDGGAHLGAICDASYPTFTLAHWGRDRNRGPQLPLPLLVETLTRRPARLIGLHDRGVVATGYRADLNIIDFERLRLHPPTLRFDLPAGGRRLVQCADGYDATLVRGAVVYRNGQATGALPGRLVRGARPIS